MNAFLVSCRSIALRLCHSSGREYDQALLRIFSQLGFLTFFLFADIYIGCMIGFIYVPISCSLFLWIVLIPHKNILRRILGTTIDLSAISLLLYLVEEQAAIVIVMYLVVIIGNGMRYGQAYLFVIMAIANMSFLMVCLFSSFWSEHIWLSSAVFLIMLVVPLHMSRLIGKLHQSAKDAEAGNRAKSKFIANMSHELRTPIHGIIGLLKILDKEADYLEQEHRKHLHLAQNSSTFLEHLIDDILDLSKIDADKLEIVCADFMLPDLFQQTLASFLMATHEKDVVLQLVYHDVPERVHADEAHLRQILLNLVGNAVKFTDHGHVCVDVRYVDHILLISIKDTGIGIEAEKIATVFEPFVQLSTAVGQKGTGLGTTIAKRFTEAMGGSIQLQSEWGVGSHFTLKIPMQPVNLTRLNHQVALDQLLFKPDTVHIKLRPGMHVLLAEDDDICRLIAQRSLLKAGVNVEVVTNGLEAWEKIQQKNYDVLITDVSMPNIDGMALTKLVRQREKESTHRTRIVGLSAHVLEEVAHACLDIGMDDFISKPIDLDVLLARLE